LLTLEGAQAGYGADKIILRNLNLRLDQEDRIALLGANGNGKTTLLRLLQGEITPLAGEVRKSGKLRVGYFNQEQAEAFALTQTAYQHMAGVMRDAPEPKVRAHLGRFGFAQARADVTIGSLSGGEKARLLFATITIDAPHVLLLDEPTNHLDIDAREALIAALNVYEGAVVLVSHDPHLVELCADTLWLVAQGTCRPFDGDMEAYRTLLLQERRAANGDANKVDDESKNRDATAASRKDQRRAQAQNRAALAPMRRAVEAAEKTLDRLTKDRAKVQGELADPAVYAAANGAQVVSLQKRLAEIERAIEQAEEAWLTAGHVLEQAQNADKIS
jgi:ATP-binding cassette subfamily F protein 3